MARTSDPAAAADHTAISKAIAAAPADKEEASAQRGANRIAGATQAAETQGTRRQVWAGLPTGSIPPFAGGSGTVVLAKQAQLDPPTPIEFRIFFKDLDYRLQATGVPPPQSQRCPYGQSHQLGDGGGALRCPPATRRPWS